MLLFRRPVDLDRFLVVFVAWAIGGRRSGVLLMFFGIVDDPQGPRPGQREVSFLGHQDYGAFTGAALAVGLAAIALGARRRLAVAAVIGGGLGVTLDASIFAYLGTILAAIAIVVVTRHLGTLTLRRLSRSAAILVVVGSGVLVLRGSDVSNYLSFLGVSQRAGIHRHRRPDRASSGRCSSGWAGRCGRTTRSSGSASTARTPTSSPTSRR